MRRAAVRGVLALGLAGVVAGVGWVAVSGYREGREDAARTEAQDAPVKPALRVATGEDGERVITVGGDERALAGLRSEPARAALFQPRVRATATVMDVGPLIQVAGQLAAGRAQLAAAEARVAASRAAASRAQGLFRAQQAVSQAEAQAADAAARADEAALAAAQAQAQTGAQMAVGDWGAVLGRAAATGAAPLPRLLSHQDVLLQVTLPGGADVGPAPATGALVLGRGREAAMRLVSAAARADPRGAGRSLFFVAAAQDALLPGAGLEAMLPAGAAVQGVVVPPGAVVWWQDRAWAYLHPSETTFVRREVDTAMPAPDLPGGFVVTGLGEDPELVVEGAQLLLSEEFRAQIEVGEDQE